MSQPWEIYDALLDGLPDDVVVRTAGQGSRWSRVLNSAGGVGTAWTMDVRSRPALNDGPLEGRPLRDVGALAKSWNLAEASIGQAAINSWYSRAQRRAYKGCAPRGAGLTGRLVFDPYREMIVGKRVAVIGHFPFAEAALAGAGEYICLERNLQPGDWPDSACEYVLPECDLVFISSSSFVNKTAPRLIELSRQAHTVLVGPSTPLNPVLLDYGVDTITGFIAASSLSDPASLAEMVPAGDIGPGFRVHRHRA